MSQSPFKQIARLNDHDGQVLALTYSSGSGQYILTGSSDRQIRLFNSSLSSSSSSNTKKKSPLIQTYSAHGYEVLDLHISPSNSTFVSCGGDKVIYLWDVASATTIRRFSGHLGRVNTVRYAGLSTYSQNDTSGTGDESLVISGSYDGTVKIWDLKSRMNDRSIMTFSEAGDSVSSVDVSGLGSGWEVLAGSVDGRVRNYDIRMGKVTVDVLGSPVNSVRIAQVNDSYLVSTLDSTVRLMDKRDGKCLQTFKDEDFVNQDYRIRSTFAEADSQIISGSENGYVLIWDILTGKIIQKMSHSPTGTATRLGEKETVRSKADVVSVVAWNQLRKQFASGGADGSVVVWGKDE